MMRPGGICWAGSDNDVLRAVLSDALFSSRATAGVVNLFVSTRRSREARQGMVSECEMGYQKCKRCDLRY